MASFRGTYSCKLDAKGRVTLPAQYRRLIADAEKGAFVIQLGEYDRVLQLYTDSAFQEVEQEMLPRFDHSREGVAARRDFYRTVENLQIDSSDRLLIPRDRLNDIGAKGELTLLGMGSYIEVWAAEEFSVCYGKESRAAASDQKLDGEKIEGEE